LLVLYATSANCPTSTTATYLLILASMGLVSGLPPLPGPLLNQQVEVEEADDVIGCRDQDAPGVVQVCRGGASGHTDYLMLRVLLLQHLMLL
jgi:hypothetical protein